MPTALTELAGEPASRADLTAASVSPASVAARGIGAPAQPTTRRGPGRRGRAGVVIVAIVGALLGGALTACSHNPPKPEGFSCDAGYREHYNKSMAQWECVYKSSSSNSGTTKSKSKKKRK